ncbi:MAG: hypothetical protein ABR536_04060 [Solirubrobacterales bacterium]
MLSGLVLAAALVTAPSAPAAIDTAGAKATIKAIEKLHPVGQKQAEEIAGRTAQVVAARRAHHDLAPVAEQQDSGDWQVGFVGDGKELVQVVVDDATGQVRETWTGYQVAWRMARGYDGAFGRKVNAPYIWLPLCAIFVIGLFDWRRPLRPANLDLLVLTGGFGVSHFFFNNGEIGVSVPLVYPVLLYLLGRALWMGFRGCPGLRPTIPVTWLAIGVLFLIGFRVGLNIADSNVIDVGYSGVVGADKIADGDTLYGNFPSNDLRGDTYGPVAYYAYVPFEQAFPWSGNWDDLPAAHAAAIFFDLATIAGLFLLGRRLRHGQAGKDLGIILAFAWAACPYTTFALESNTNDSLVAALLVATMLVLSSPAKRGVTLALSSATKFAPLPLAPLFATYVPPAKVAESFEVASNAGARTSAPNGAGASRFSVTGPAGRAVGVFSIAFAVTLVIVMAQTLFDPGIGTFIDRTIDFQSGRDSPFSIWGQVDLGPLRTIVLASAGVLASAVAFLPRHKTPETVAALAAAVLIAFQLTVEHWFYLYVPWFFGLYVVAMVAGVAPQPVRVKERKRRWALRPAALRAPAPR